MNASRFPHVYLILVLLAIIASLVSGKLETVNPAPSTPSLLSKCLTPFASYFAKSGEPFCSIEEFSGYTAEELMKLSGKQISSLPSNYFESLKIEQAAQLSPGFITQLQKDQAMAVPKKVAKVLHPNSRKVLNKIRQKPGPIARTVIMILSAATAYVIFRYS